jgi:hypothetical protein
MSVTFKVRNKDKLFAKLRRSVPGIEKAVTDANVKSAGAIVALQKSFAPVDDGDLRDSITMTLPGGRSPAHSQPGGSVSVPPGAVLITAGNTKVRYAHLVEYGTAPHPQGGLYEGTVHPGNPPQPYFWPAVRLGRRGARSRASRAINKELKRI